MDGRTNRDPEMLMMDLSPLGPLVPLALVALLMAKEYLMASQKMSLRRRRYLNAFILPLLIIFVVQVVILLAT